MGAEVERSCGDCSLCCTLIGVAELSKPKDVPCLHLAQRGCGIFGKPERPKCCGGYRCGWLRGYGSEDERPDRVGFIASMVNSAEGLYLRLDGLPEMDQAAAHRMAKKIRSQLPKGQTALRIRWVKHECQARQATI